MLRKEKLPMANAAHLLSEINVSAILLESSRLIDGTERI